VLFILVDVLLCRRLSLESLQHLRQVVPAGNAVEDASVTGTAYPRGLSFGSIRAQRVFHTDGDRGEDMGVARAVARPNARPIGIRKCEIVYPDARASGSSAATRSETKTPRDESRGVG
jgi:hypothetical protein